MLFSGKDLWVRQEQNDDMLRRAEKGRLIREARAGADGEERVFSKLLLQIRRLSSRSIGKLRSDPKEARPALSPEGEACAP